MEKTARDICTPHLEALGGLVEKWGLGWRIDYDLPEHMGATLTILSDDGEETAGIDALWMKTEERAYVVLNLRAFLLPDMPEEALEDMGNWLFQVNVRMPLGSILAFDRALVIRYSMALDADQSFPTQAIEPGFELFFAQRGLYMDTAAQLAYGAITLEEAVALLG